MNAAILAAIGFLTVLAGITLAQLQASLLQTMYAGGISFLLQFFIGLAIQRGLKVTQRFF